MTLRWSEANHQAWKARQVDALNKAAPGVLYNGRPAPVELILPWPPSGNHGTRHANGAHYLTAEHRAYRIQVGHIVALQQVKPVTGPLRVLAHFTPPDKRRRDLDNLWKVVGDALQRAGVYADDSAIEHLTLERLGPRPEAPCVWVQVRTA